MYPSVYARRSLCYLFCNQPDRALHDGMIAQEVFPDWPTAFYLQSVALSKLNMITDSADTLKEATLLEATLKTGRTHQIRVHLQSLGYPIAGDDKYGDREFNQLMKSQGLTRMFLQAVELAYRDQDYLFGVCSLLDEELVGVVNKLRSEVADN